MKLTPDRIDKARFTRVQLEWMAWTLYQSLNRREDWPMKGMYPVSHYWVAEFWADQLEPHVNNFNRDKFVKAVTTGEI